MSLTAKLLTTAGFTILLLGIGAADALIAKPAGPVPAAGGTVPGAVLTDGNSSGIVTQKSNGPDVFDVLNAQTIATETTKEESLIGKIVPKDVTIESRVLLKNNDRVAFFSWADSPNVKDYFMALKEALRASFSSDVRDLVDENQERIGKPTRNVLSFVDPAIHEDRLLFIRVRQRIYEFHVAPGHENDVQSLMDALTE